MWKESRQSSRSSVDKSEPTRTGMASANWKGLEDLNSKSSTRSKLRKLQPGRSAAGEAKVRSQVPPCLCSQTCPIRLTRVAGKMQVL